MKKFICLLLFISISFFGLASCSKQKTNLTQDFSMKKVKKININNNSWNLLFKSSNDDEIHVETSCKGDKSEKSVDIGLENGVMHITQNDASDNFIGGFTFGGRNKIIVYVPKDLSSPINVENKNGDITMENVSFSDLKLTNSSGNQKIINVKLDHASITSESADTTIKDSSIKKLQAESKSGCLYFTNVSDNEIYASTSSGEIVFKDLTEHQASDINTGSGDISVLYKIKPTSLKLGVKSNSKDVSVHLDELKLKVDTEEKKEGTIGIGDNRLKISSDTGTINIR
ncbi:DUF4097 domain-containing protein [Clostridium estertheticum]|uniref:DUF4097 family beta strand repeat-containing protein n=1 Tax=Clostridium estertheticum TaxID=238834 RepID=UPI001C7D6D54|nr:DUF4097 family beta strand repeat-containing protein [Clostridium estertheticum]MBX4261326.1 DUF4097 domain-containing protein [Clostridium estertheticum]WLC70701.1 DUF4097 domain-containing protein [Clostridium estertheticum]